jgi:carbon-monoxide dehydrogenase iron sulfur subunit
LKVIGVHLNRCTACKTCELYCATERGSNGKTLLRAVQETPIPQARVRVEGSNTTPIPLQCRQCLQAPCLDACLSGALIRDSETNMVVIREDRCIGCWTCTVFCPYGVIYAWPESKTALKCDRCAYMEHPVCVEACPTQALELIDMDRYEEMLQSRRAVTISQIPNEVAKAGILLLELGR